MSTADLYRIAEREADVNYATQTVGADQILAAEDAEHLQITKRTGGIVTATWALNQASDHERRNNLHLWLTQAGRDHLRSAA